MPPLRGYQLFRRSVAVETINMPPLSCRRAAAINMPPLRGYQLFRRSAAVETINVSPLCGC